jgi:hypothetical protein
MVVPQMAKKGFREVCQITRPEPRAQVLYSQEGAKMNLRKVFFIFLMMLLCISSVAIAGDFDWIKDLNIQAQADPSGFRARLGARFKIGDVEIKTVLGNVECPGDAYMVLRLGEMSRHPTDYVLQQYRSGKGKGWGALAKSLGIKPGSEEFHALKNGHDLYNDKDRGGGDQK